MPPFKFNTITRAEIQRSKGGDRMINAIDFSGENHMLISGCPGSGKTTVCLMRAQRLANEQKSVAVFSYQNLLVASLRNLLQENVQVFAYFKWYGNILKRMASVDTADEMIQNLADTPRFEEILIDEGQDFEIKILQALISKCSNVCIGADNAQRIHKQGMTVNEIDLELSRTNNVQRFSLEYNYRNTFEIYNFARYFVPEAERANNPAVLSQMNKGNGNKPIVFKVISEQEKLDVLKTQLQESSDKNIAILVYYQQEVDYYHAKITEMGFTCAKYHNDFQNQTFSLENILITTYKSAKGLEFETVIMPSMENAMKQSYETQEHYYVACTRTKESLVLLINCSDLPSWLVNFPKETYELISPANILTQTDLPF